MLYCSEVVPPGLQDLDYYRWILEADVEAALEMFLELQPPLPPSTVLPLLAGQVGAAMCHTLPHLASCCCHKLHSCCWQARQALDMYMLRVSLSPSPSSMAQKLSEFADDDVLKHAAII